AACATAKDVPGDDVGAEDSRLLLGAEHNRAAGLRRLAARRTGGGDDQRREGHPGKKPEPVSMHRPSKVDVAPRAPAAALPVATNAAHRRWFVTSSYARNPCAYLRLLIRVCAQADKQSSGSTACRKRTEGVVRSV